MVARDQRQRRWLSGTLNTSVQFCLAVEHKGMVGIIHRFECVWFNAGKTALGKFLMYRRKAKENRMAYRRKKLGGREHYFDHRKLKFAQDPLIPCRIYKNLNIPSEL